jgi:arabinogalactan endo-1,4-beta-galactosidase
MIRFVLALFLAAALSPPAGAHDFYFGADLSFADEMSDCGALYKDGGAPKDVFALFKDHGYDLARIRIWVDPHWTNYSTGADVKRSIKRARAAGMKVLLDFHYSDDWADGDKQIVPAAWANIKDTAKLADTVYRYTFDVLAALDQDGLMPDMVQVGNETNGEILMPAPPAKGQAIDWVRNAALINAGIKAVRDAGAKSAIKPLVMLHIAQPENVEPWFADAAKAGVADFDEIGISYYPKWSKYALAGLTGTINRLRHRYPKVGVMVVETAYPWTVGYKDNTGNVLGADSLLPAYRPTPEGQKQFLSNLTQAVINGNGNGVVYWAPDWVSTSCRTRWGQGSSWENATLFDFDGKALPAVDYPRANYTWPVVLTFRFHGVAPPAGGPFVLWGDFLGVRDIAVRLPDAAGKMEYTTTIMPGQEYRLQVFSDAGLKARLIAGAKVADGFYADAAPNRDTTVDIDLAAPP